MRKPSNFSMFELERKMSLEHSNTYTPERLRRFGRIEPQMEPGWDDVPHRLRDIWIAHARKALPELIKLFGPRFVTLQFYSAYEARLILDSLDCGPINLFEGGNS